jgi:hypothetical protein
LYKGDSLWLDLNLISLLSLLIRNILEADAIYAVFYQNKPINIRTLNKLVNYPGPKYKKVSFSNSGHAFNLRDRLNKKFNTDEFSVVKLTHGETITRDQPNTG